MVDIHILISCSAHYFVDPHECPTDMTFPVVKYNTTRAVEWTRDEDVTCDPSSGFDFPIGTTDVTCSRRHNEECSFKVIITGKHHENILQ